MPVPRSAPRLILNLSVPAVHDQGSHSCALDPPTALPAWAANVRAGSPPPVDQDLATTHPPRIEGSAMRPSQTPRRSLQTTLAVVALGVTALLAPATSAVASPTHPQAPRVAHAFAIKAVLPSDPRELTVAEKGG